MQYNEDMIFALQNGEIILRDFKNNQEFSIGEGLFKRLLSWSENKVEHVEEIDQQLAQAKLLQSENQATGRRAAWQWDDYSYMFHQSTRDLEADLPADATAEQWLNGYFEVCDDLKIEKTEVFVDKTGPMIALPEPDLSLLNALPMSEILKRRKTCREFEGQPVEIKKLGTLLYAVFGDLHRQSETAEASWSEDGSGARVHGLRKSSPSGGSLHPTEAYVVCNHIDGIDPGVYHYSDRQHALTTIRAGNYADQLPQLLSDQFWSKELSFGIFLTTRFERSWWKYSTSRAYRVVLMDIGHLSQTFLLAATALGLQTWLTGAFNDSQVEELLEVNSATESAMFFVGAGVGTGSSFPRGWFETYGKRAASEAG